MIERFKSLDKATLNSHHSASALSLRKGQLVKCSPFHKLFHKAHAKRHADKIHTFLLNTIVNINAQEGQLDPSSEEYLIAQRFNHLERTEKIFKNVHPLPKIDRVIDFVSVDKENIQEAPLEGIPENQKPYILNKRKKNHYYYNEDDLKNAHGKEAFRIFKSTQKERFLSLIGRIFKIEKFKKYDYFLHQEDKAGGIYAQDAPLGKGDKPTSFWIGHATCLVSIPVEGMRVNLITDPVEGDLNKLLYPRMTKEARKIEDCPAPHIYMLSHNHLDHYKKKTIKKLLKYQPILLIPEGDGKKFRKLGFKHVYEQSWWNSTTIPIQSHGKTTSLKITAVPANHWSGQGLCDGHQAAFLGYVIHNTEGDIYFAGDTARLSEDHIATLREQFNIRSQFQPGGPDEMRKDMKTTHQASIDGVWMHFNLMVKNLYFKEDFRNRPKEEFLEAAKKLQTIYMHTKTFKLGNLHFDDTERSIENVKEKLRGESPELKDYEEQVYQEILNISEELLFSNGEKLTPKELLSLIDLSVHVPKIGERTDLLP